MINIPQEEIEYMSKLTPNKNSLVGEHYFKAHLTWATDGCVGKVSKGEGALVQNAEKDENHMAYEVVKNVQEFEENDQNGNFFKIETNSGAVKGSVLGLDLDLIIDAATEIKTTCKVINDKSMVLTKLIIWF
jgi:hypothetical protein